MHADSACAVKLKLAFTQTNFARKQTGASRSHSILRTQGDFV